MCAGLSLRPIGYTPSVCDAKRHCSCSWRLWRYISNAFTLLTAASTIKFFAVTNNLFDVLFDGARQIKQKFETVEDAQRISSRIRSVLPTKNIVKHTFCRSIRLCTTSSSSALSVHCGTVIISWRKTGNIASIKTAEIMTNGSWALVVLLTMSQHVSYSSLINFLAYVMHLLSWFDLVTWSNIKLCWQHLQSLFHISLRHNSHYSQIPEHMHFLLQPYFQDNLG